MKLTANRINNQSSKYRGVSYNKEKKKYTACITYKKKTHKLGYFNDELQAAKAYNDKVREICPDEIDRLNIIGNEDDIPPKINNQSSKYRGVSYNKIAAKYTASITHNHKQFYIGSFNIEIDAAKAYNDKALELHGKDYKHFNIIPPLEL